MDIHSQGNTFEYIFISFQVPVLHQAYRFHIPVYMSGTLVLCRIFTMVIDHYFHFPVFHLLDYNISRKHILPFCHRGMHFKKKALVWESTYVTLGCQAFIWWFWKINPMIYCTVISIEHGVLLSKLSRKKLEFFILIVFDRIGWPKPGSMPAHSITPKNS